MARGFQGAVLRALGAGDHVLTVVDIVDVVDGYRRIRFHSETLFDEFDPSPANFVRLWVPDPDDAEREHQRGYTVIDADPAACTFAVEFVLHEPAGPAGTWASRCQRDDQLRAAVYGSTTFVPPGLEPAGYLLVGDPASTPAINAIVGAVPGHVPIELYLEWAHDGDRAVPVADHPRLRLHRVRRDPTGAALVSELDGRDWSNWYAWVAAERTTTKAVKSALKEAHGFPKSEMKAQAYWIQGKSLGASRGAGASAEPAGASAEPADVSAETAVGRWRSQAGVELLAPVKGKLWAAGLVQGLISLGELVPFLLLVELARRLLDGEAVDDQWPLARLALVLLGVFATLGSGLVLWLHVVDARFGLEVRRTLLAKLSRLPLGWFTERNSAAIKQAVLDDTARLHYLVTHAVVDLAAATVTPLAVLVYLFVVDARLAAVLLVPIIAYLFVFSAMMRASGSKVAEVTAWSQRMNGEAVAYISGMPVVRAFGGASAAAFRGSVDSYIRFLGDWQRPFVAKKATAALLTSATTFLWLVATVGGLMVIEGWMSPLTLLPFLLLGTTFGPRLLAIAYGAGGLRESVQAARRIGIHLTEPELAAADPAATADPSADETDDSSATVRFREVTFGYRRDQPVIHDVDLTLVEGTVTALVGPSGSGKSTLAALVARFHDVDSGSVSVGGVDVRRLDPDDLYRRVGFVLQDVQLVRASVHDNIALARPDATRDDVIRAAIDASIHERIERLPRGYDSVVGEDANLSGGEAQRVTIARALVADTPVVILDEATAFADPESERQVQVALGRLMRGRTVLVIAHRLHTVVDADQIVVLDDGHVVQRGTHAELLAVPGRYGELWREPTAEVVR